MRAAVLGERELDYVQAAQLRGERAPYIMFVEILPNVMGPIVVEATVRLGYAIFAVAALTFLGFGVQPPSPDWSLADLRQLQLLIAGTYWWTVLFPALAIATLVVGVNLVADGVAAGASTDERDAQATRPSTRTLALELDALDVVYQVARTRTRRCSAA